MRNPDSDKMSFESSKRRPRLILWLLPGIVLIFLALAVYLALPKQGAASPAAAEDYRRSLGPADAPVTHH